MLPSGSETVVRQRPFVPSGPWPLRPDFHPWDHALSVFEEEREGGIYWVKMYYSKKDVGLITYWYNLGYDMQAFDYLNEHVAFFGNEPIGDPYNGYCFHFFIRDNYPWTIEEP